MALTQLSTLLSLFYSDVGVFAHNIVTQVSNIIARVRVVGPPPMPETRRYVHLPPELHHMIIDHLYPIEKKELASYATVSKVWELRISFLLHSDLVVTCDAGRTPFRSLLDYIVPRQHLSEKVLNLSLRGRTGTVVRICTSVITCEDIISIVEHFPNLQSLSLSTFAVKTNFFTILYPAYDFQHVRLDRLTSFEPGSNPYQILSLFDHAVTMEIVNVRPGYLSTHGNHIHTVHHEVTTDDFLFTFPLSYSVDIVGLLPVISGARKIRFRNVYHEYTFAMGWMLFDSRLEVEDLEIELLPRGFGEFIVDYTCLANYL